MRGGRRSGGRGGDASYSKLLGRLEGQRVLGRLEDALRLLASFLLPCVGLRHGGWRVLSRW